MVKGFISFYLFLFSIAPVKRQTYNIQTECCLYRKKTWKRIRVATDPSDHLPGGSTARGKNYHRIHFYPHLCVVAIRSILPPCQPCLTTFVALETCDTLTCEPPSSFSSALISRLHLSALSQFAGWLISRGVRRTKKGTPTGLSHQGSADDFPVVTPGLPSFVLTAVRLRLQPPPTYCGLVKQLFQSPLILFLFSIV